MKYCARMTNTASLADFKLRTRPYHDNIQWCAICMFCTGQVICFGVQNESLYLLFNICLGVQNVCLQMPSFIAVLLWTRWNNRPHIVTRLNCQLCNWNRTSALNLPNMITWNVTLSFHIIFYPSSTSPLLLLVSPFYCLLVGWDIPC